MSNRPLQTQKVRAMAEAFLTALNELVGHEAAQAVLVFHVDNNALVCSNTDADTATIILDTGMQALSSEFAQTATPTGKALLN